MYEGSPDACRDRITTSVDQNQERVYFHVA